MKLIQSLILKPSLTFNQILISNKIFLVFGNINKITFASIESWKKIKKHKQILLIEQHRKKNKFFLNINLFFLLYKQTLYPSIKTLILNGVGYKCSLIQQKFSFILECNFGFSHKISLNIPRYINVLTFQKKKKLVFKGYKLLELNNFIYTIKNLRLRSPFTGQGFWLKKEKKKITFKPFKTNAKT